MSTTPQHIAIIMDGNRRWARQHGLEVLQGHAQVANKVIEPLVEHCIDLGIQYVTLWAFSTENWGREKKEVEGLMNLFRESFSKNAAQLHKQGVRLRTIGDLSAFPSDIQENIAKWVADTAKNNRITVIFALNYGGRNEIVRACQKIEAAGEHFSEETIGQNLDTADWPDPDLLIRPGGEMRLSGYMPWQAVYAELYFTPTLMPDFSPAELDKALADYAQRQRRFGK